MTTLDTSVVDAATVAQYRKDGCTVVRGLFSPDEVEVVRAGIERNLAEPGPLFGVASRDDDPGRFVEDFCNWQRIDEFRSIAFESRAADVAAAQANGQSTNGSAGTTGNGSAGNGPAPTGAAPVSAAPTRAARSSG